MGRRTERRGKRDETRRGGRRDGREIEIYRGSSKERKNETTNERKKQRKKAIAQPVRARLHGTRL